MKLFNWTVFAQCDTANNPFGCVGSPVNSSIPSNGDPIAQTASFMTLLIRLTITVGAITCLIFLLWGGYDYVTSGGEKEKVVAAQRKITYAVIGIIFMMLSFGIFAVIADNVLGIVKFTGNGFIFSLPTFNG